MQEDDQVGRHLLHEAAVSAAASERSRRDVREPFTLPEVLSLYPEDWFLPLFTITFPEFRQLFILLQVNRNKFHVHQC